MLQFIETLKISHPTISSLYLKRFQEKDAEALFKLLDANRSHLRRWLASVYSYKTPDDYRKFIEKSSENCKKKVSLVFGLCNSSQLLGVVAFINFDWEKSQDEIGYWIGQAYQGHGFVLHACKTLIDYGFNSLSLKNIVIACAKENARSRRIPELLKFVPTKIVPRELYGLQEFQLYELSKR